MPRANRYLVEGYTYHLTHRCRDAGFLLRFIHERNAYREWLRVGAKRYRVPVYAYTVTANHAHVVVHVDDREGVGRMMQLAAGQTARDYNRRKDHSGPFWEDQYQCTMVEDGRHLWNCLRYVDLNMVRAGRVQHPRDWRWCGWDELAGKRRRYRILSIDRLAESLGGYEIQDLRAAYEEGIDDWLGSRRLAREPAWTEAVAVGSKPFVRQAQQLHGRRTDWQVEQLSGEDGGEVWAVRESGARYG